MKLQIVKLDKNAKEPKRADEHSAGYDIYSNHGGIIKSNSSEIIGTGIAIKIPHGYYGLICSRSGLSFKNSCEKGAGVIDSNYRGEIKLKIYNHGKEDLKFEKHQRLAQMIIHRFYAPEIEIIDQFEEEKENKRNTNGFGSTGLN